MARRSKARSLAFAIRQSPVFSAAIENPNDTAAFATAISTATGGEVGAGGSESVATAADLPLSGNEVGDFAFVQETNRLYIWNGSGWYNIALINTNPSFSSNIQNEYNLDLEGGNEFNITLTASDPEGLPIQYSLQTDSASQFFVDVLQNNNVFTFTTKDRSITEAYSSVGGQFNVSFIASDGVNQAVQTTTFKRIYVKPTWITDNSSPIITVNKDGAINYQLSASELVEYQPVTYSLVSGTLPTGVSLNNSGLIQGSIRPWEILSDTLYTFTVRATNTLGQYTDKSFSIQVLNQSTTTPYTWKMTWSNKSAGRLGFDYGRSPKDFIEISIFATQGEQNNINNTVDIENLFSSLPTSGDVTVYISGAVQNVINTSYTGFVDGGSYWKMSGPIRNALTADIGGNGYFGQALSGANINFTLRF